MLNLVIRPMAELDLLDIETRIKQNSPRNAQKVKESLKKGIGNLLIFPNMGVALRGKFNIDTNDRMLINSKYPYVTIYEVIDKTVYILRVLPSKSEYIKTLGF